VRVISRCQESWFDECQGRGEFLSRVKTLRDWSFQSEAQERQIILFMKTTRSELVGRYEDATVGRNKVFFGCSINIFVPGDA